MARQDFATHIGLALGFGALLLPYVWNHGFSLGAGIYLGGTGLLIAVASASFVLRKE
jgi:hypothetical protein